MTTPMQTYMSDVAMQSYLKKALESLQRKGSKPSKSKIKARWTILRDNMPSLEQYERITKFITKFYGGFDGKKAELFMEYLENIMLTDPGKSMKSHEYYLKIFKI